MLSEERTKFDYLFNAVMYAAQEPNPAKHDYRGKTLAMFAYVRDLEAKVRLLSGAGEDAKPPFGSKRKAALALYRPPFRFLHGYIYDAAGHIVADQDGFEGKVAGSIAARVRGWGRISYMPDPEALQDEVGAILVEALNKFWADAALSTIEGQEGE
jgi:hypothetical protein